MQRLTATGVKKVKRALHGDFKKLAVAPKLFKKPILQNASCPNVMLRQLAIRKFTNPLFYFCAKKSFTLSLCRITSLKVYAPDLGLRTALITFVKFFASAEAFKSFTFAFFEAAFAMIN